MALSIVPVTFRQAREFIRLHHRHHRPPAGMKFALGVAIHAATQGAADGAIDRTLVGVAVVGRPVARHLDDTITLEVTRSCTDGTRNANSMLYAAAWRITRELGYRRLVTSTEDGESGASLRAAGFQPVAHNRGHHGWNRPSRPRTDPVRPVARTRWELTRSTSPPAPRCVPEGQPTRPHQNGQLSAEARSTPRGPHRHARAQRGNSAHTHPTGASRRPHQTRHVTHDKEIAP